MKRLAIGLALLFAGAILVSAFVVYSSPFPEELLDESRFISTSVTDRDGALLRDGLSEAGGRGAWLGPDEVPEVLANAVMAAEDHRFSKHPGIDPLAVGRAVITNVRGAGIREGGSTITQQVVKMLLRADSSRARSERDVSQKLREAVLALRLERIRSKEEILALWLNLAPYGGTTTGARRASLDWFGAEPRDLELEQAALLAGVPNRPSVFDPLRYPDRAEQRRNSVLRRMLELGMIDAREHDAATTTPVTVAAAGGADSIAPHAVLHALGRTLPGTAAVELTLDAELQRDVQGIITARRRELDRHGAGAVAVVVLDNTTGEWLAWEGSGSWGDQRREGSIDGVTTPRHPGSALKPFVYAAAFEQGFTPASVLPDVPSSYKTANDGVNYVPRNYDGRFRGPVLARAALAGSLNVPAVHVASEAGVPSIIRLLRAASISTLDSSADWYGLGMALGGGEVRLDELTSAYATFARQGVWQEPRLIRRTRGHGNDWVAQPPPVRRRIVSEEAAFLITDILSDPVARSYVFGRDGALELDFPVAVKTGTSQAYRDNWTIGYTDRVTVGVWVGNFDQTPLRHSSGVTGAAPIFNAVMRAAHERYPGRGRTADAPPTLSRSAVCALSGSQPGVHCPRVVEEWLPVTADRSLCTWHRTREGDAARSETVLPDTYAAWSASQVARKDAAPEQRADRFAISQPADGTVYLLDETLRSEFQTVSLRVSGGRGAVHWRIDGRSLGTAPASGALDLPLRRGRHVIVAEAAGGKTSRVSIEVR